MQVNELRRHKTNGQAAKCVSAEFRRSRELDALLEIKLALSRRLRQRRACRMTQRELADRIGSSQPRIALSESGDGSVSMELLVRALLATGATPGAIGRAIAAAAR